MANSRDLDRLDKLDKSMLLARVNANLDKKWGLKGFSDPFRLPIWVSKLKPKKEDGNDLELDMENAFRDSRRSAYRSPNYVT